jgi:hypothetical protein
MSARLCINVNGYDPALPPGMTERVRATSVTDGMGMLSMVVVEFPDLADDDHMSMQLPLPAQAVSRYAPWLVGASRGTAVTRG